MEAVQVDHFPMRSTTPNRTDPAMLPRRHPIRSRTFGTISCVAAVAFLVACDTPRPSGRCAYVASEHLSVARNDAGRSLICDPMRVAPAYRERYFPEIAQGDET